MMPTTLKSPNTQESSRPSPPHRAPSRQMPSRQDRSRHSPLGHNRDYVDRRPQHRIEPAASPRRMAATQTHPTPYRKPIRRPQSRMGRFINRFTLEKWFTVISFLLATALIVLCMLDLAIAWPWRHARPVFDWTYLGVGIAMLWLTYDVFKDQSRR
ncbi:hypothetical protein [Novipirellula sp.]|uniref:hypothetical protein n=1 Tax=Novipirellula sp. TaxID=2795430 RepID=UPI003569CE2F